MGAGDGVQHPGREMLLTSSTLSFSLSLAITCWKIRNMFSTSFTLSFPVYYAGRLSKKKNQVTVSDVF